MVTERLARAIEHIAELPEEEQNAIADQIEAFWRTHAGDSQSGPSLAGVWSDLPDDMEETLLRWRNGASQIDG